MTHGTSGPGAARSVGAPQSPAAPQPPGSPRPPARRQARHHRHSRQPVLRAVRIAAGSLLLIFGILAGFIPIIQGWVLVLAGLSLLSTEVRAVRMLFVWTRRRWRLWRRSRRG